MVAPSLPIVVACCASPLASDNRRFQETSDCCLELCPESKALPPPRNVAGSKADESSPSTQLVNGEQCSGLCCIVPSMSATLSNFSELDLQVSQDWGSEQGDPEAFGWFSPFQGRSSPPCLCFEAGRAGPDSAMGFFLILSSILGLGKLRWHIVSGQQRP